MIPTLHTVKKLPIMCRYFYSFFLLLEILLVYHVEKTSSQYFLYFGIPFHAELSNNKSSAMFSIDVLPRGDTKGDTSIILYVSLIVQASVPTVDGLNVAVSKLHANHFFFCH
jgi:hypothetical protein